MVTVREIDGYWVEVSCSSEEYLFSRVDVGLVQLRVVLGGTSSEVPKDVEFALEDHGYAICGHSPIRDPS